jgi:hypothetical protein
MNIDMDMEETIHIQQTTYIPRINREEYIHQLRNRIHQMNENEFVLNHFEYEEYQKKEKEFIEKRIDMIEYLKMMRKQSLLNKNKSARANEIIESDTLENAHINIFDENVFQTNQEQVVIQKKKIEDYTKEELKIKIEEYMKRKNIRLNQIENQKLNEFYENDEFEWKKQISMLKESQNIVKIHFFKKNVIGDDIIQIDEEEKISKEEMNNLERRKKFLKKFKK